MANAITIGRLLLLFVVVWLIYVGDVYVAALCAVLIAVVFASDGIDGYVARRRGSTSDFGAVFDIAGDRVVENTLWVVFAEMQHIPVWVPILVLTRGFLVDGLRSLGLSEGKTPFGEKNMMRSEFTRWLTAGRFMRALFGYVKAIGFVFLTGLAASEKGDAPGTWVESLYDFAPFTFFGWACVWLAVALTVIRGLPVMFDAYATFREQSAPRTGKQPAAGVGVTTPDQPGALS
jgi:CDP-diacylglycerol---glycerol-3-phosphate 3-phosphatidyltransferase